LSFREIEWRRNLLLPLSLPFLQRSNTPQPCIDRWLQSYEHAQRRRERNNLITPRTSLIVDESKRPQTSKGTRSRVP
jgi:hypothetical protein